MKLTEDDIASIAHGEPTHWYLSIFDKGNSKETTEQLKQQILDDHEKARKWDRVIKDSSKFAKECDQNQKLRKLIEDRIDAMEKYKDDFSEQTNRVNNLVKAHLVNLLQEARNEFSN